MVELVTVHLGEQVEYANPMHQEDLLCMQTVVLIIIVPLATVPVVVVSSPQLQLQLQHIGVETALVTHRTMKTALTVKQIAEPVIHRQVHIVETTTVTQVKITATVPQTALVLVSSPPLVASPSLLQQSTSIQIVRHSQ